MVTKRLMICVIGGALSGLICLLGAQIIMGFPSITLASVAETVANRIVLGFVIGISGWRINYLAHGALIGLIVSLSVSIAFLSADAFGFLIYTAAGVLYGLLIEVLATVILKSPMGTARLN